MSTIQNESVYFISITDSVHAVGLSDFRNVTVFLLWIIMGIDRLDVKS